VRVEQVEQVGDADAQVMSCAAECLASQRVARARSLADDARADPCQVAVHEGAHLALDACTQLLPDEAGDARARSEGLHAAAVAAAAQRAIGHYDDVPCLARQPAHAQHQSAIRDDAAAHAGADSQVDDLPLPAGRAPQRLRQPRDIGIVAEVGGPAHVRADDVAQRHVVPARQVGRADDDTLHRVQRAGRADADAGDLLDGKAFDHFGDGILDASDDGFRAFQGQRRPRGPAVYLAVRVTQCGANLRAAQVHGQDSGSHACSSSC